MSPKFTPKGEDVLKQEVIKNYGLDESEHADLISKIVADRLKDEKMKASLHEQKTKAKVESKNFFKAKEYYKGGGKPKGAKEPKRETDIDLLVAQKVYLAQGGTNTEVRQIRKIMAATGKKFDQAQKDTLFLAWKNNNDAMLKDRKSQLGPSRGGSPADKKGAEPNEKEKGFLTAMGVKDEKK